MSCVGVQARHEREGERGHACEFVVPKMIVLSGGIHSLSINLLTFSGNVNVPL
jgi:hypothetical protein